MRSPNILFIITGGIAAYKSLEVMRLLNRQGIASRCILTKAAQQFVTPLSVAALSKDKVYTDMFSLTDEIEIGHIALSRQADLVFVCPASADFIARAAHGLADDLATTVLLATDKPVVMAPAMNVKMWEHPATQANLATLRQRGVSIIPPVAGSMACGEFGVGRLPEPEALVAALLTHLHTATQPKPLAGKAALVTAGATWEPLDPVRFLGNRSSGKQGYAIANALARAGATVTLVSGISTESPPPGVHVIHAPTATEMLAACLAQLPADIAICAAAVADWQAASPAAHKQKKQPDAEHLTLDLVRTPDILATLAQHPQRPRLVIGFAAETEHLATHAAAKLQTKGCDWIVGNLISADNPAFGASQNQVSLFTESGQEDWPNLDKDAIAQRLVARVVDFFAGVPDKT
jgi:phosphopantothenoylcysteine decarboxylase/phosphopantothenate--cysteine ligase